PYSSLLREGFAPPPVTRSTRGLLPHDFTLACASTADPHQARGCAGHRRCVSVALSLGPRRVAVSDLPALWSPDFPPAGGACPPAILRPTPVRATVAPGEPAAAAAASRISA